MMAHAACWCQCNSRMPPASSRIFTPAMVFDSGNKSVLTWRARPPACWRRGAMLNDDQNCGMPPTSVAGGLMKEGRLSAIAGFCGPGSEIAAAVAFTAPCGGKSGLPNTAPAACAAAAVIITPPVAPVAKIDLRDNLDMTFLHFLEPPPPRRQRPG